MTPADPVAGTLGKAPPRAPANLSAMSRRLWRDVVRAFEFGHADLVLLESAFRSLDRAESCRAQVAREGVTVVTERTGAVHVHPAVRVEAEARREFRISWRALGLLDGAGK